MLYYTLKNKIIINVTGRDSRRYLNSRLTNDIKSLKQNESLQAGLLSPQGKTLALFDVISISSEHFLLICDGGDRQTVLTATSQYIVADKVTVEDQSDLFSLTHIFYIDRSHGDLKCDMQNDELTVTPKVRTEFIGIDLLCPEERILSHLKNLYPDTKEITDCDWLIHSFRSNIPTFPREIKEGSLFSSSGIKSAIASNKGCYVGQEVIEKIDAYGKLPLCIIQLQKNGNIGLSHDASIIFNDSLETSDPKSVGKVLSFCYDSERNLTYTYVEIRQNVLNLSLDNLNICGACGWKRSPPREHM